MKKCPYCKEDVQDKAKKCRYCWEWFIWDEKEEKKKEEKTELQDKKQKKNNTDNKQDEVKSVEIPKKEKKEDIKENNQKIEDKEENKLEWLSGWLTFVWLWLILSPFMILWTIIEVYSTMINDWSFAQLITSTSSSYIPWFLPLAIFEFFGNLAFIVFATILIYYYFSKHKLFPLLFKIYVVSFFIFNLLDYIIPDIAEIEDDWEYLVQLIRSFIYMLIWGSYMHVSKRVKNTFVNEKFWKVKIIPAILIWIIWFIVLVSLSNINLSKLSYDENEYATNICVTTYWVNSIYSWEQDEWQYLCDCKEWYEFWWDDWSECVISSWASSIKYTDEVFNINSWLYFNNAKTLINEELDKKSLKQINEDANKWFLTNKWNYALFIPEKLDQETADLYADEKNKNQNQLWLKSIVLWLDWKNIVSDIKKIWDINFFTFTYEVSIDGDLYYYYAIFWWKGLDFINVYLMWASKNSIKNDWDFIINNLKINK